MIVTAKRENDYANEWATDSGKLKGRPLICCFLGDYFDVPTSAKKLHIHLTVNRPKQPHVCVKMRRSSHDEDALSLSDKEEAMSVSIEGDSLYVYSAARLILSDFSQLPLRYGEKKTVYAWIEYE